MDEVDKIIIQSLRQIDALIDDDDDDTVTLTNFTPERVVRAVSACLCEIKPDKNQTLPRNLPVAIAQRFMVATALAEACTAAGYRGDIGYQTFLYPNTVDLRRLFMYLIEHLPRAQSIANEQITSAQSPLRQFELVKKEIQAKILKELQSPWVPQYCRSISNRRANSCSSSDTIKFNPQLNLHIPSSADCRRSKEVLQYFQQQSPNVFQQQQTGAGSYDLISSVLHKNAIDFYAGGEEQLTVSAIHLNKFKTNNEIESATATNALNESIETQKPTAEALNTPTTKTATTTKAKTNPIEKLNDEVMTLKEQNEEQQTVRNELVTKINMLKAQHAQANSQIDTLRKQVKIHERTCVVLEQPAENVPKLEALVATTKERRHTLEEQWKNYRKPLEEQLHTLNNAKKAKNAQSIMDMRQLINELEQELREKTAVHMQLNAELKSQTQNTATRKEYTRRIHEFIGNIRKQSNDIFKVLDDTRDLQKQLNSVSAQLQRQFNYTDDLLFQSAKHDLHAKKAYKLLATLHANCTELVELVAQTGNVTKEIRDLEVQIDNERIKNIASNLEQITGDITKFENLFKELQTELRAIENEITTL